jgi:uncharacterized protein (DUF362 family)
MRIFGASAIAALPASALPLRGGQKAASAEAGEPFPVGLIRCADYSRANLLEAIRAGWRLTRPPDVRGKRIVIKPNIADFSPERPIHTDARLVEALVAHLKEMGAGKITVGDGPPHNRDTELLFRQTGYEALAERQGLSLIDLNYDDLRPIRNPNPRAGLLKDLSLAEAVLAADVIISVPKLKTHRYAGVTLSLKNMFGILPGMVYGWPKNILHWNGIPLSICEINGAIKSHFSIVDGVVGMEGYGPLLGSAKKAGVLVMGDNALAVDATAARVMGVEPGLVEYMIMAQKLKLGSLRRQDIAVSGESIDQFRTDFALDPEFSFLRAPKGPLSGPK